MFKMINIAQCYKVQVFDVHDTLPNADSSRTGPRNVFNDFIVISIILNSI